MLLQVPTAILLIILVIAIIAVVIFLIFVGVINFGQNNKRLDEYKEEDSLGDQVKERQDRLDKEKENE